tara:strand:- start:161 stop:523 length:363 start_codon:yes stop_codon:yes gene_type:complete
MLIMRIQDKFNEGGGTGRASFQLGYITDDKIGNMFLAVSLIDRGMPGTRSVALVKALNQNDWVRAKKSITACDEENLELLLELEPRIVDMIIHNLVDEDSIYDADHLKQIVNKIMPGSYD